MPVEVIIPFDRGRKIPHPGAVTVLLCCWLALAGGSWLSGQPGGSDLQRLLEEAVRSQNEGRYQEAIEGYEAVLQQAPPSPEILSNLGAAYAALGNYPQAIASYERALALADNPAIRLNLGIAYYKALELEQAIPQLEQVLQRQPDHQRAAILLADCFFRLGENRKVIEILEPFREGARNNLAIAYLYGTALIRDGQPERGMPVVDVILRQGDSAEAHLMMGTAHWMARELDRAVEEFRTALTLNPRIPGAHSLLGQALLASGNREEAIRHFREELKLHPHDFEANFYLGFLLREERQFQEALAYLEKSKSLRPRALEVDYQMATLHLQRGEAERARHILESVVQASPRFVEAHVSLATAYYRLGMKEKGDEHRKVVLQLNAERQKEQPGAQEGLGPAYRGELPAPPRQPETSQP